MLACGLARSRRSPAGASALPSATAVGAVRRGDTAGEVGVRDTSNLAEGSRRTDRSVGWRGSPTAPHKAAVNVERDAPKMTRRTGSGIALLADDTRRTIVALIALHPRHPTELSRELGLSLPAISRQLGLLTRAGLVRVARSRIDGRRRMYAIDTRAQGRILAWLAGTDVGLEESMLSRSGRAGGAVADSD